MRAMKICTNGRSNIVNTPHGLPTSVVVGLQARCAERRLHRGDLLCFHGLRVRSSRCDHCQHRIPCPRSAAKAASEINGWIRGSVQRSDAFVEFLGLHVGETIADVGTGVCQILPYIVRRIGSKGAIFAVDLYPEFIVKTRQCIAAGGTCGHYSARTTITQRRSPTLRSKLLERRADHVHES